ncbi:MAG: hypothetical protein IPM35_01385 [Myxococcales bacterium]|nr:hypothetical protein [Myxococcales bacterium]
MHLRLYPLAVLIVALLACKKQPPAPAEYEYRIFVEGRSGVLLGAEMAGKPLDAGKQEARGMSFSVKVPAAEHAADRAFSVVLSTSCGTEKVPAKLALGIARAKGAASEDRERQQTKPGDLVLTELEYTAPKVARVYLDTDGAGGAKVLVGAIQLAATKNEHDVVLGSCATAREVKVDGKVAGSVVDAPRTVTGASGKKLEVPGTTLVDPTGKHCYEVLLHTYVDKTVDTTNMAASKPKRLEGASVHATNIDDFLKESPKEIKSEDDFPSRYEIRRCATKRAQR